MKELKEKMFLRPPEVEAKGVIFRPPNLLGLFKTKIEEFL
jgi:hypothetical protein